MNKKNIILLIPRHYKKQNLKAKSCLINYSQAEMRKLKVMYIKKSKNHMYRAER